MTQNNYSLLKLNQLEERIANARDFVEKYPHLGAGKTYLSRLLVARASKIGKNK